MKTVLIAAALSLVTSFAHAAEVNEWRDLEVIHTQILEQIKEMERARFAKRYDTQGHAAKAEHLLHDVEKELHDAVEALRKH